MSKKKFDCVVHFETIHYNEQYTLLTEFFDYYSLDVLELYQRMNAFLGTEVSKYNGKRFVTFKVTNVSVYVHLPNGKYFVLLPENESE